MVQVKNGPIDFQPREPFHPLFGAMPKTPLMMEFQITKEYLGFATHLVYLGPLFEETLASDTRVRGGESTVARIIEGRLSGGAPGRRALTGMAWCGQHRCRSQLERLAFRSGQLVRLRSPGLGSDAVLARNRRGVGAHDFLQRRAFRRAGRRHDDGLARSGGGLHDAPWACIT
jgi:hypothetical protein